MGFTPNLKAAGNILPNRFVKITGANTGDVATAATDVVIGVTDGSLRRFDATYNSIAGDPIPLQQPNEVFVSASAAIAAGAKVSATAAGQAVTYSNAATTIPHGIAMEAAAAAGDIIRIWLIGGGAPGA